MANTVVDTSEPEPVVVIVRDDETVEVVVSGEGPRGPSGEASGADKNEVFNQGVASALWTIKHNLNKFPSVTVFDSAKTQIEGDVTQINSNELTVAFGGAFSGVAYLN